MANKTNKKQNVYSNMDDGTRRWILQKEQGYSTRDLKRVAKKVKNEQKRRTQTAMSTTELHEQVSIRAFVQ